MKKLFFIMLLFFVAATGSAQATPVIVDFSGLVGDTDIAASSLTLNGLTMSYDNGGSATQFGNANKFGIQGTTYGTLNFNLSSMATALNFDFSVLDVPGADPGTLQAFFSNGDVVTVPGDFTSGDINGSLAYNGADFDQVTMFFEPLGSNGPDDPENQYVFQVGNISYEPAAVPAVPEPASMTLLGLGLAGLARLRRKTVKI